MENNQMPTEGKEGITPGEYLTQSTFVYVLRETGDYRKGQPIMENAVYANVQGPVSQEEKERVAQLFAQAANLTQAHGPLHELVENMQLAEQHKQAMLRIWGPVDEYVRNHPRIEPGDSVSSKALEWLKQGDELVERLERAESDLKLIIESPPAQDEIKVGEVWYRCAESPKMINEQKARITELEKQNKELRDKIDVLENNILNSVDRDEEANELKKQNKDLKEALLEIALRKSKK